MKYPSSKYAEALAEADHEKLLSADAMRNFVKTLRKNRDMTKLPVILNLFERLLLERAGIAKIDVISARDISEEIGPEIKSRFGDKVLINYEIRPEIIGGVILRINDEEVVDASIARRVEKLFKNRM